MTSDKVLLHELSSDGLFRVYEPDECSKDGYPRLWHDGVAHVEGRDGKRVKFGIKHLVREQANHRCVRCLHPYVGGGEWSACDERCAHGAPHRWRTGPDDQWWPAGTPALHDSIQHAVSMGREVQAQWRILTVHHLRLGAEAKRDLRWWNLAALCQRCHLQIQGKVVMERIWPWPHSDWFKPYAAGWYAHAYLGEDLTRAEVEARMDELLALELVA